MEYLRKCKALRHTQREKQALALRQQPMQDAWNSRVIREGDMIGGDLSHHPNQFSASGVLRHAWRSLGHPANFPKCLLLKWI